MTKDKWRLLLRSALFLLVLAMAVGAVQRHFGVNERRVYDNQVRFYEEKRGSLDGVYIGGSEVHAFWQPAFGWADKGVAVWNYSFDGFTPGLVKPILMEVRKTQPDALYIISLSTFKKNSTKNAVEKNHRVVDYIPFSLNKFRIIRQMARDSGYGFDETLELLFPIVRFHSRWDELTPWAFGVSVHDYKSSNLDDKFNGEVEPAIESIPVFDDRVDVPEDVMSAMTSLLDYCDQNKLKVLFVKVPQVTTVEQQGRMNTLEDLVRQRGYPCLDLMERMEDMGLDAHTDFYNDKHTNVHGSVKVSQYLCDYLVENYGFEDKRGRPEWKSWDAASRNYIKHLGRYLLPFEGVRDSRTDLPMPRLATPVVRGQEVDLAWEASEGADGYEVFRLGEKGTWESVADLSGAARTYTDRGLEPGASYAFTVAPYREEGGGRRYGSFCINGETARTEGETA